MNERHHVANRILGWVPVLLGVLGLGLPIVERVMARMATRGETAANANVTLGTLGWTGLVLTGLGMLVLLWLAIIGRQDAMVTLGALLVVAALILGICLI